MAKFTGDAAAAAAANQYPVAPAGGPYYLKCEKATEKKALSGRDMFELELVVSEGDYAGRVRIWHYLTLLEPEHKAHGLTLHQLKAFGISAEGDVEITEADFEDKVVVAELEQETYKGNVKNVVDRFVTIDDNVGDAQEPEPPKPAVKSPAQSLATKPAVLVKKPAMPWAGRK